MIVLICGASHTGKTLLAQKLLERYHWPYLSIDHLKMGLIRSGQTTLTPEDDDLLQGYLWPIVREIVKTAIENGQDLVVEGCYIPPDWKDDFSEGYLEHIRAFCLVMTERYIHDHFEDILAHANDIERRLDDSACTVDSLLADNAYYRAAWEKHRGVCILIDDGYEVDVDLPQIHGPSEL